MIYPAAGSRSPSPTPNAQTDHPPDRRGGMPAIVITPLSDPVAVVQLEIASAERYPTRLYWTIENASKGRSEFFNYTSNEIEITFFASLDLVYPEWLTGDPGVRVSAAWRVFEISSGDIDDGGNYDSPHLRHVSAPLAEAGISILYQSSYYTDFLLVKETDFVKASSIFASHGWHVEPELPSSRPASIHSPLSSLSASTLSTRMALPTPPLDDDPSPLTSPLSLSPVPPTPEITVLPAALTCVGFSAERDVGKKVNELLVWPERVRANGRDGTSAADTAGTGRPFISYTKTQDGCSLLTDANLIRALFPDDVDGASAFGDDDWDELADDDSASSVSSVDGEDHLDGPIAAAQCQATATCASPSDVFALGKPCSRSVSGFAIPPRSSASSLSSLMHPATPPDVHVPFHYPRNRTLPTPTTPGNQPSFPLAAAAPDKPASKARWSLPVLARTHGLSSSAPTIADEQRGRTLRRTMHLDLQPAPVVSAPMANATAGKGNGTKRCLQLDMRGISDGDGEDGAYHLDKSGLVTLFSTLLGRADVRMLYSSTFHTANILVKAGDVRRAGKVLGGRAAAAAKPTYLGDAALGPAEAAAGEAVGEGEAAGAHSGSGPAATLGMDERGCDGGLDQGDHAPGYCPSLDEAAASAGAVAGV